MSTAAATDLFELYGRYKHLALSAGAALLLKEPLGSLEADAAELLADARTAAASWGDAAPQLRACIEAASELHGLLRRGGDDVEATRRTHRQLRREVWKVIPCEYVPCCASARGHE